MFYKISTDFAENPVYLQTNIWLDVDLRLKDHKNNLTDINYDR